MSNFKVETVDVDFANASNFYTTNFTVLFDDGTFEDEIQWTAEELADHEAFKKLYSVRGAYTCDDFGKIVSTDDIEHAIQIWEANDVLVQIFQKFYNEIQKA